MKERAIRRKKWKLGRRRIQKKQKERGRIRKRLIMVPKRRLYMVARNLWTILAMDT